MVAVVPDARARHRLPGTIGSSGWVLRSPMAPGQGAGNVGVLDVGAKLMIIGNNTPLTGLSLSLPLRQESRIFCMSGDVEKGGGEIDLGPLQRRL